MNEFIRYRPIATAIFFTVSLIAASIADAKDLFVATNGNDSLTYAANAQATPWRTIEKGVAGLLPGDTLYIRGGTYQAAATIDMDSRIGAPTGTQANPIHVTSFASERVVINLANVGLWLNLIGVHYWQVSELEFINADTVIEVGGTALVTENITIRNNRMVMNRDGDNHAAIRIGSSVNALVDGNEVIGPGISLSIHQNTGCIFTTRQDSVKILNNILSNCPNGIHYKHANTNSPGATIEIAYNYIFGCGRGAIHYNGNYGHIHDNIIGVNDRGLNLPLDNGVPGGHNNIIEHNTFVGTTINLQQAGGGPQNNVIRNNLFTQPVIISEYLAITHNTSFNYNLHPQSVAIGEFGTDYSLAGWRTHYGDSSNSLQGTPTFVGGANPTTVGGFQLAPSSAGAGAASDGTDVGARINLFGGSGLSLTRPQPPRSLTAL